MNLNLEKMFLLREYDIYPLVRVGGRGLKGILNPYYLGKDNKVFVALEYSVPPVWLVEECIESAEVSCLRCIFAPIHKVTIDKLSPAQTEKLASVHALDLLLKDSSVK